MRVYKIKIDSFQCIKIYHT